MIPAGVSSKPPVSYRVGLVETLSTGVGVHDPSDDGKLGFRSIMVLSSWRWEVVEARQVLVPPAGFIHL